MARRKRMRCSVGSFWYRSDSTSKKALQNASMEVAGGVGVVVTTTVSPSSAVVTRALDMLSRSDMGNAARGVCLRKCPHASL